MFFTNYVNKCNEIGLSPSKAAESMGYQRSTSTRWSQGSVPRRATLQKIASFFGCTVEDLLKETEDLNPPTVTEDYVTFPVLGGVAAGYDHIAEQDWSSDVIDVPASFLKKRDPAQYFVLRVEGNSMYPDYMDGDKVLVQKQTTMDRSGQVGVVIYEDELATLKRVEYVMGEDWMTLRPINPQYPPITVEGADLERCRVLGVPRLVIREVNR